MIYALAILIGCAVLFFAFVLGLMVFTIHNEGEEKSAREKMFENFNPLMQKIIATSLGGLILFVIFGMRLCFLFHVIWVYIFSL